MSREFNAPECIRHQPDPDVGLWWRTNQQKIRRALDYTYDEYLQFHYCTGIYAFSSASLSERGLCPAMMLMPLPHGFSARAGKVSVFDSSEHFLAGTDHVFGWRAQADIEEGEVFCITFGQFYDSQYPQYPNSPLLAPGERIRRYKLIAPNLVHILDDQVAVLSGKTRQIREQLRLQYAA